MHTIHRNELPQMGAQGEPRHGRRVSTVSSSIVNLIRHNSYSILAAQRSSRERVFTSHGSWDEAPSYCQYLQLLMQQLLIFLKNASYRFTSQRTIIRLHGQCRFVNWSDSLLFFFQVILLSLPHCVSFLLKFFTI